MSSVYTSHNQTMPAPPCNTPAAHVVVQGLQAIMPPSRVNPPRRVGYFPIVFTVRFVHPSPYPNSSFYDVVRHKTVYEFWLNCDDFSCTESGIAAVDRLVDLMDIPFSLHGVQLFWKSNVGKEVGAEESVPNWDDMAVVLHEFLRRVRDLVFKQDDEKRDEMYPRVQLKISKFVRLPEEELEAVRGKKRMLAEAQMQMEWRMAVLQAEGIKRVKFDGGEEESCGICLTDMSVGSEVARLPCSHYLHERCILKWLRRNNSCPNCRFKIVAIEGKTRPKPEPYWLPPGYHQA